MNIDVLKTILLELDIESLYNMSKVDRTMATLMDQAFWFTKFAHDHLDDPHLFALPTTITGWYKLYVANKKVVDLLKLFPKVYKQIFINNPNVIKLLNLPTWAENPSYHHGLSFYNGEMTHRVYDDHHLIYHQYLPITMLTNLLVVDPTLNIVDSHNLPLLYNYLITDRKYFEQYSDMRDTIDSRIQLYKL